MSRLEYLIQCSQREQITALVTHSTATLKAPMLAFESA